MKLIKNLIYNVLLLKVYITFFDDKTIEVDLEDLFDVSATDTLEGIFNELKAYEGMDGAMEFTMRYGDLISKGERESISDTISKELLDETPVEPVTPTEVEPEYSVNGEGLRFECYYGFDSDFIKLFVFYPEVYIISVQFKSGTSVAYSIAGDTELWGELKEANSKGSFYNKHLKKGSVRVDSFGLIEYEKSLPLDCTHYVVTENVFYLKKDFVLTVYKNGAHVQAYSNPSKTALLTTVITLPF